MNKLFHAAVTALLLTGGPVLAECEGGREPFPIVPTMLATNGHPFVSDGGTAAYPALTGQVIQSSTFAALEPSYGTEEMVQTATSLPTGFDQGSIALAQARNQTRSWAAQGRQGRVMEAGRALPRG